MSKLIKPKRLKKGDRIAIVSLSWGGLGDEDLIHKYIIAKERLENDFHLENSTKKLDLRLHCNTTLRYCQGCVTERLQSTT